MGSTMLHRGMPFFTSLIQSRRLRGCFCADQLSEQQWQWLLWAQQCNRSHNSAEPEAEQHPCRCAEGCLGLVCSVHNSMRLGAVCTISWGWSGSISSILHISFPIVLKIGP